jgi:hypothetical protein
MAVIVNEFARLRQMFPEWTSLKTFLTETGGLRVIESEDAPGLAIVRYVKEKSKMDCESINMDVFRSVIIDTATTNVVCMAPPKSKSGLVPLLKPFTQIEDFVDGFMLQVFMKADGKMHLATRTQIGAKNTFYSSKTFATLFEESLSSTPIGNLDSLRAILFERLSSLGAVAVFASFVIQHPEHRVVMKYRTPSLSMVHLGWSSLEGTLNLAENASLWPTVLCCLEVPRYLPQTFSTNDELNSLLRDGSTANGFCWQGLVFKDGTGNRWKMRSSSYLSLRTLRGGEALPVDRFLRLRKSGKVSEYLKHYSEDRTVFWGFEQALREKTGEILKAYESVNKTRATTFAELDAMYKPGVFMLHAYYLSTLRPEKKGSIMLNHAINIVNSMKVFEQRRLIAL